MQYDTQETGISLTGGLMKKPLAREVFSCLLHRRHDNGFICHEGARQTGKAYAGRHDLKRQRKDRQRRGSNREAEKHGAREGTRTPTPQWRQDLNLVRLPISPPSHLFGARNFTAFCPVWDGLSHRIEPNATACCPFNRSTAAIRRTQEKRLMLQKRQQSEAAMGTKRMRDTKKATARMKQAIMAASSRG